MKMACRTLMALGCVLGLALADASAAIIPLYSSGGALRDDHTGLVGGTFTANASGTAVVNQLGFFDNGNNGLAQAHDVGLYEYSGTTNVFTLLAKATIPAGTSATLDGGFRWLPISPVTLSNTTNEWYMVLASVTDASGDGWYESATAFNAAIGGLPAPRTYTVGGSIPMIGGTTTVEPAGPTEVYAAGNVGFLVPEPSSLVILGLGTVGLFRVARRRKA